MVLLNSAARVPVCGVVSQYNATEQVQGLDRLPGFISTLLKSVFACKALLFLMIMAVSIRNSISKCLNG